MRMKIALITSLLLNVWFQFGEDLFLKYVDYTYCKGTPHESVQYTEYYILGIPLFHIHRVVATIGNYDTVTCMDGSGNNPKKVRKAK